MNLDDLYSAWSQLWVPEKRQSLSEWAEENFKLSEYSAVQDTIRLYGWQRSPMDAFTDPRVETVVLMCSTQMLKTILIQAALAYAIDRAPGPALLLHPNDDDAKTFSKERLAPMIRDCTALASKVAPPKKDSSNTINSKEFPGGSLTIAGARTPGNLARRSIRYLLCDEVDKYPESAGAEGDPIGLAVERTVTYRSRRKIILACSPTIKGKSRIGKAYDESDQRRPYAPCPHCGHKQVLSWGQVRWDNSLPIEQRPGSAYYECEKCAGHWNDNERWKAANASEWRASAPFAGTAGFWINHLYSPWKTLADVVRTFLKAKDHRASLITFVNTNLAQLWEDEGDKPQHEVIMGRRERYEFGLHAPVPARAVFLTAGVDVQDDRLELEVVAHGRNRETWSIAYEVIRVLDDRQQPIPTSRPDVWAVLDEILRHKWRHESGAEIPIMAMCVDCGFRPKPVYEFAMRHPRLAVSAAQYRVVSPGTAIVIKGVADPLRAVVGVSKEDAAHKRHGIRIVSIGTGYLKQEFYDALKMPRAVPGEPAAGYPHFPMYEEEYFLGLTSEKRIIHSDGTVTWEKERRNEPLDCRVYARAAAILFGADRFTEQHWDRLVSQFKLATPVLPDIVKADKASEAAPAEPSRPPVRHQAVVSSSWMRNFLG